MPEERKEWRVIHGQRVLVTICELSEGKNKSWGRPSKPDCGTNYYRHYGLGRDRKRQREKDPEAQLVKWITADGGHDDGDYG